MRTIVINSQKGGSAKTTLSAHLSVEAERSGDGPVYLIDTDPQGSLTTWHRRRTAENPHRIEIPFDEIPAMLPKLAKRGAAYCIIDTAPSREDIGTLLSVADFVLVPVQPSPQDVWSAGATVQAIKTAGKRFLFVLSRAKPNTGIALQTAALLSKHGQISATFVTDRIAYATAMTDGRTAQELQPKGPAAKEMQALWTDIKACLHESMPAAQPHEEEVAHA